MTTETQRLIDRDIPGAVLLAHTEETDDEYECHYLLTDDRDRATEQEGDFVNLHQLRSEGGRLVGHTYFSLDSDRLRKFAIDILAWCDANAVE